MKQKRILYSILVGGWGGLEKYPLLVHKHLSRYGYKIYVLTGYNTELHRQCEKQGIPVFTINRFRRFSPQLIKQMHSIVIENKIDIVHSRKSGEIYNWRFALWKLPSIRFIISFHIGVSNKNNLFHRFFYKRVDKVIGITDKFVEKMKKNLPVPADRIVRLYNGIDLSRFQNKNISSTFRKESGIPAKAFVFTGIGNLSPSKGVEEFIRAASVLNKKYPDLFFIWVGKDTYSSVKNYGKEMKTITKKIGLARRFVFTGYRNDIPAILHDSDVFVMASYHEAFGNVYIEAMAMGLPVIGCSTGGVPEIIKPGENGFLVAPHNCQQLAAAMEKYLINKDIVKIHGNRSRVLSRQFDIKNHIKNLIRIYELGSDPIAIDAGDPKPPEPLKSPSPSPNLKQ